MIRWTAIPCIALALTWDHVAADEPILLDPKAPHQVSVEVPLFGYRRFPQQIFTVQKGNQFGLPTELIYSSAAQIPEIKQEAAEAGKSIFDMEAYEVVQLVRSQSRWEEEPGRSDATGPKTSVPWVGAPQVDAGFITRLVSSELIDQNFSIFEAELLDRDVEMVSMDLEVARNFWSSYSDLESLKFYDPFYRADQFNEIGMALAQYPALLEAAKINFSPVSFGETFSYSAQEKGLEIAPSILRKYDVYWVEFAVSLRDLNESDVTEISFHVFLPDDSIALDLIPRRFGHEMQVSQTTKSPEITVKQVSLGEFYSRTVAYTALKPTIVATGLRENQFSWVLTDDAVATGAYLFVGILGVPTGQDCINTGFGVNAKTSDFLGLQGDVAGTGIIFKQLCFV
jgi:hypothetical protein